MAKTKVLVIDDDPSIIRLNESLLGSNDYDVISAINGDEGLTKAMEEVPDVIILDLILPKMHGFEVCKILKGNNKTKDIPIIIVTASGLEDVAKSEEDVHADVYMSKPYGAKELMDAIGKAI